MTCTKGHATSSSLPHQDAISRINLTLHSITCKVIFVNINMRYLNIVMEWDQGKKCRERSQNNLPKVLFPSSFYYFHNLGIIRSRVLVPINICDRRINTFKSSLLSSVVFQNLNRLQNNLRQRELYLIFDINIAN